MKFILTTSAILLSLNYLIACSCPKPPSLCEQLTTIEGGPTELVFLGEYIQSDTLSEQNFAVQYKITKLYRGSVITPDSPLAIESDYENTDSTIWMLGGNGAQCLHWDLENQIAFFAIQYEADFFGYQPSICRNDFFKVESNQYIHGPIYQKDSNDTLLLEELQKLVDTPCLSSTELPEKALEQELDIFPNPATDIINIKLKNQTTSYNLTMTDLTGRIVKYYDRLPNQLNVSSLKTGFYFLHFKNQYESYSKRILLH